MSKTKKILIAVAIVIGLVGLVYFVILQVKIYNTVVFLNQQNAVTQKFLTQTFPDQVNAYNASLSK